MNGLLRIYLSLKLDQPILKSGLKKEKLFLGSKYERYTYCTIGAIENK